MPNKLIPYKTILAAKAGDYEAMQRILRHYAAYIAAYSKRTLEDEYGNKYEVVDEQIRQRIETKLMHSIIYKFDPYKQPPTT